MLVTSMGAYSGGVVFADVNSNSVTEVDGIRTSITYDNTTEYKFIFDFVNNTVKYSERNLITDERKSSGKVEINSKPEIETRGIEFSQTTKALYKYIVETGVEKEWYLQRPRTDGVEGAFYFKTFERDSNKSELNTFKSEVDTMKQLEDEFEDMFALGILNNVIAGLVAGAAVATGGIFTAAAALLEALIVSNEVEDLAEGLIFQSNDCMYAIEEVYYNSIGNVHF